MNKTLVAAALMMLVLSLSGTSLQLSRPAAGELKISFQLPDFRTETELKDEIEVRKLKVIPSGDEEWKENFSGLPQLESWIYVPAGYDAQISLSQYDTQFYNDFDCFKENNSADSNRWLDVSQTAFFRGNRIVSFCVKPFQYNTDTRQLQTLAQAEIRVRFTPDASNIADDRYQTPNTVKMLQSLCINRDDVRTGGTQPGSYVVIYNGTNITSLIQPYLDWKREKGYQVHTLNTAINGNTTTAIKSFLQNAYDTWTNPPEHIMIFGRGVSSTNYVPTYTEYYHYNTVGDYKYTLLDGTDLVPDAYIGRITFSNDTELTTAVNRMVAYEKMQGLSTTNWLSKYFLLGDPSDSGTSCITTAQYIKGLILGYNPDALITEAYSGSFPSQINAAINAGIGSYYYRGHGDFSGWTATDINNLNNIGKYFFFSYITCFSGNFGSSTVSQAERLIRLGTPSVPKGAIGVIAATCETHTCLNNIMTGGIAYGLYVDGMTQGGPALVRGKLAFMANYPQNPANYVNQYMQSINLLGDPGLDIWMKEPSEIVVSAPTELYSAGENALVRVTLANGDPVEGAWVSLVKGSTELAVNGYTDANGWLILQYGAMTSGTAKLTVTKPNHKTFQTSLAVGATAQAVSLLPITALQQCPSGATLDFSISLMNNSTSALTGLSASLEALSDNVEVNQASSAFPEILPGSSAVSLSTFSIQVAPDTPKGSALYFILHVTGQQQILDLPFACIENGPDLTIVSVNFTNNLLNHGTNLVNVTMQNNGSMALIQLQAILESNHPLVSIPNPTQNLGPVGAGQLISLPTAYVVQVADSLAEGINVRFLLQLHNSDGFLQTLSFEKKVGLPTDDDFTGPDSYGYVCYGPGDDEYVPYNWMEIDPTQGGTGTIISITDTDTEGSGSFQTITLPFQFRFYGKSYSQITVCSNGFIMPGTQGSIEWMNWAIPGPMVPRPIIAPFWDDLLTDASSRIVYKHDPVLNAEIIQWQNLKNKFMPSLRETFQAILYDPVYHAGPTGDSPILFQYKVFNNVDSGNYGVSYIDHGQYATIGIGDHTGIAGITYTFNNQYPPTAQTLGNLTTLYFNTLPPYQTGMDLVILNTQITEVNGNSNGLPDAGEQLSLTMTIKNLGLSSITESQVILTSNDPYVTIIQEQAELPSLASNQIGTTDPAFVIQIASNCPNHHIIDFSVNIENTFNSFDLDFDLHVNALELVGQAGLFTDTNNNFPEPGESGTLHYTVKNISLLDAQNLMINLIHPPSVTVDQPFQTIDLVSQESMQLSFPVTFSDAIEQGSILDMGLQLSIIGVYDSLMVFPLLTGVPEVFLDTGFDAVSVSDIFQSVYYVTFQPSVAINQTGYEAVFDVRISNPFSYAFCYPMQTNDLLAARLNFTWFSANTSATISLMALYPESSNLFTIWSSSEMTPTPRTEYILIDDFADYENSIVFVFVVNATADDFTDLYIDDLKILTVRHAPGFISGHVNLDLHPELVTNVNIKIRYTNQIFHPDENGNYLIPAYNGTNILTADCEGYASTVDSILVNVTSGQVTTASDFYLQRLRAPINLTHTLVDNLITLSWDLEGEDNGWQKSLPDQKLDRFLVPDYYRIYIRWNNFNFGNTSTTQSYSHNITLSGTYQFYAKAAYLLDGTTETLSTSSDTLFLNFTSNDGDASIPIVYALKQNHPNPFNPETSIGFSLPETGDAVLKIYNIKGQEVKTLVNEQLSRGHHNIIWNGRDEVGKPAASGIYYYRLKWQGKELTRKMILLK